jgi:hypothetical protein
VSALDRFVTIRATWFKAGDIEGEGADAIWAATSGHDEARYPALAPMSAGNPRV